MSEPIGCWTRIARTLAGLLALLFILALPATILLHNIGGQLFSTERMTELLARSFIDSGRLQETLVQAVLESGNTSLPEGSEGGPVFLAYLDTVERAQLVAMLVPPDWARAQLEHLLTGLYAWIDGRVEIPDLSLDVEATRARLLDGGLEEMMTVIIDSLPACTDEQLADIGLAVEDEQVAGLDTCLPPEPARTSLIQFATQGFRDQIEALPNRIPIGAAPGEESQLSPELAALRGPLRAVRLAAQWGWLLPASLLGVIMTLAVRSWKGLARWWGVPMMAASVLTIGISGMPSASLRAGFETRLASAEMPAWALETARDLTSGFEKGVRRDMAGSGALVGAAGIALLWAAPRFSRTRTVRPAADGKETVEADPDAERPTGMFG
jgi:hypothetical protein